MKKNQLAVSYFIFILFFITLLIGFFNGEAISGAGAKRDFYFTWDYVLALENNIFTDPTTWTIHTPLHYFILSSLNKVTGSQEVVRFGMTIISVLIPILFYFNLKIKFPAIKKNILILLASSIFLYPSYRYSAIWANSHITGLIFFLLSTYYFIKWEKSSSRTINWAVFLSSTFLAAAIYTRQYYAFIFFYYLYFFFFKLYTKDFLKISFFIFILSLPGFFLISEYPLLIKNAFFTLRYHNTLLINSSIISFYLIPFFLIFCLSKSNFIIVKKNLINNFFISAIITLILILVGFNYFDFNNGAGGGFLLKVSYLFFKSPYLFFLSSLVGFFLILFIINEDKKNVIIFLILLLCFSGYIIYQKSFEPMFLFILFLLINTKLTSNFLKKEKSMVLYYVYLIFYLVSAFFNDYLQLSSKILS